MNIKLGDFIDAVGVKAILSDKEDLAKGKDGIQRSVTIWQIMNKKNPEVLVGWVFNSIQNTERFIFSFLHPKRRIPDLIIWEFSAEFLIDITEVIKALNKWNVIEAPGSEGVALNKVDPIEEAKPVIPEEGIEKPLEIPEV